MSRRYFLTEVEVTNALGTRLMRHREHTTKDEAREHLRGETRPHRAFECRVNRFRTHKFPFAV